MEDRIQVECVHHSDGSIDYLFVGVFDGHGGAEASDHVRKNLLRYIQLQEGFNGSDDEMKEAIRMGYIQTHLSMLDVIGKPT